MHNKGKEVKIIGFMEKVGAKIATKYGTVTEGVYKGTQVALGNDPNKKVEFADRFEQIIFVDGTEEKGRHNINDEIVGVLINSQSVNGLDVAVMFRDEQKFMFVLEWKKEDGFGKDLLKQFLGAKKTNQTEKEKNEDKYHHIKTFVLSVFTKLTPDSVDFLEDFYQRHDIMDEISEKMFSLLKERFGKSE